MMINCQVRLIALSPRNSFHRPVQSNIYLGIRRTHIQDPKLVLVTRNSIIEFKVILFSCIKLLSFVNFQHCTSSLLKMWKEYTKLKSEQEKLESNFDHLLTNYSSFLRLTNWLLLLTCFGNWLTEKLLKKWTSYQLFLLRIN